MPLCGSILCVHWNGFFEFIYLVMFPRRTTSQKTISGGTTSCWRMSSLLAGLQRANDGIIIKPLKLALKWSRQASITHWYNFPWLIKPDDSSWGLQALACVKCLEISSVLNRKSENLPNHLKWLPAPKEVIVLNPKNQVENPIIF